MAAGQGDLGAIVDLLDRAKISIDVTDGMGLTALHVATITSQVDAAQLLLTRGASPHKRAAEFQNGTALHAAAHEGNVKMARVLLAAGAPVGATDDDGGSALHTAVTAGDAAVTRLLLDAGAPVDLANGKGFTALHLASQFGNEELIRVLVAGGADVNALAIGSGAGRTALHVAAFGGKIGAVRALIESGASFTRSRLSGGTPLDDAICLAGHQSRQMIFTAKPTIALQIATDLLSSLDAAREAAAAPHPWQGQTPLHAVAYRNVPGSAPAMVELLKSYGAVEDATYHIQTGDQLELDAQAQGTRLRGSSSDSTSDLRSTQASSAALRLAALEEYAMATRIDPHSAAAYMRLGAAQSRVHASSVVATQAVTVEPSGAVEAQPVTRDEALASFRTAHKLLPNEGAAQEDEEEDAEAFARFRYRLALAGIEGASSNTIGAAIAAQDIGELSVHVDDTDASHEWAVRAVGLWRRQGVVVFPSLLNRTTVDALKATALHTLKDETAIDRSDSIRESGIGGSLRSLRAVSVSAYREALGALASKLAPFLAGALNDERQLMLGSSVLRTSPGAKAQGWHRDNSLRDDRLAKAQIALGEQAAGQGVIEVQPATHNRLDKDPKEGNMRDEMSIGVPMAVPAGTVVFYAPTLRHRGGAHELEKREDRLVFALTLQGEKGMLPCGIPITAAPEDVGRWWIVNGTVRESAL